MIRLTDKKTGWVMVCTAIQLACSKAGVGISPASFQSPSQQLLHQTASPFAFKCAGNHNPDMRRTRMYWTLFTPAGF